MKRFVSVVVYSAVLAAWVGAQAPHLRPSPADQARMVSRNRPLYRVAVERGLHLSAQMDALERAGSCTEMAKVWAREIQSAATAREAARVAELGKQLTQVVEQGVVPNLTQARQQIRPGSLTEPELFKRRDEAVYVLNSLAEALRGMKEFEAAWKSVADGLAKVENAAKPEKK